MKDLPISVAFVCVHNACRSQIAEALARQYVSDCIIPYSAGTDPANEVDPHVTKLLSQHYGIDPTTLSPKTLADLPKVDLMVSMGCAIQCPTIPGVEQEQWKIEDPAGKDDSVFMETIEAIRDQVVKLKCRILAGAYDPVRLASNLKLLGDPNRLHILNLLSNEQERCACELLDELDIKQSTLSHHMSSLKKAHLVSARKEGQWMHYRLNRDLLAEIGKCLSRI